MSKFLNLFLLSFQGCMWRRMMQMNDGLTFVLIQYRYKEHTWIEVVSSIGSDGYLLFSRSVAQLLYYYQIK